MGDRWGIYTPPDLTGSLRAHPLGGDRSPWLRWRGRFRRRPVAAGEWASVAAALEPSCGVTSLRDCGVSRDLSLEDHVGLDALDGTGHGRYHCLVGTRVDCQDTNCTPWPRLAHRLWNRTCSERASPL